jgi:hypothetical protein
MPRDAYGKVKVEIEIIERNTAIGPGDGVASIAHRALIDLLIASGTGDGQVDRVLSDALTLTTTPTDLDLAGSIASDIGAGTVVFAEVSLIVVQNTSEAGDIVVGGDTNALLFLGAAAQTLSVKPGGFAVLYAPKGYTVTAGTGDILQLAASAGTVTGKLIVAGRSA